MLKRLIFLFSLVIYSNNVNAKSVILMIGDGMGYNHLSCAEIEQPLFLKTQSAASVMTFSADNETTDSAASATTYSCGIKTNNYWLGLTPDMKVCKTIAEEAVEKGKNVYIMTTDNDLGATPSAFYAHTTSRNDNETISRKRDEFSKKADLKFDIVSLSDSVEDLLQKLSDDDKEYFVMIEGAKIDKASHKNDLYEMKKQLIDFDAAVKKVWQFAQNHSVNVYITADHETGALRAPTCKYFSYDHTPLYVPLWIYGNEWDSEAVYDNTDVYKMMHKSLFED